MGVDDADRLLVDSRFSPGGVPDGENFTNAFRYLFGIAPGATTHTPLYAGVQGGLRIAFPQGGNSFLRPALGISRDLDDWTVVNPFDPAAVLPAGVEILSLADQNPYTLQINVTDGNGSIFVKLVAE